jgi:hypothetical protein
MIFFIQFTILIFINTCTKYVFKLLTSFNFVIYLLILITRYDYNLTIMKSPKPATDTPKPATDTIYPHIKFWWYRTMLNFYPPIFMPCFGSHFENGRHLRTEFHETSWSYRYMFLVDPKVFRFVVKGVKAIFLGVQRGWGLL